MLICGIDFETTGLLPTQDRIIEVGAVLWDWETGTPLQLLSNLVHPLSPIPEEITKITGITDEQVDNYGRMEGEVFSDLRYLIGCADYVMAHNGTTFDKLFYAAAEERLGYGETLSKVWLDTKTDIKYPEQITTRKLQHLAAEHDFLNPFSHRAVFDVLTMLRIANCYNIDEIIVRAQEPTLFVRALVSFDEKELAKARGYNWCASQKVWWRVFKESDYVAQKETCGFETMLMPKAPE